MVVAEKAVVPNELLWPHFLNKPKTVPDFGPGRFLVYDLAIFSRKSQPTAALAGSRNLCFPRLTLTNPTSPS
jgi:hypothetical protein